MTDIVKELRQGSLNNDDYRWKAADRIAKLEAAMEEVRDILADVATVSLPNDYPTSRMAEDRMRTLKERTLEGLALIGKNEQVAAEVERLRAALEIMSMMGVYTKLHPDEAAPGVEQNSYSWGVSDGYKEMAAIARAALEEPK